ncbi:aldehyde dehydrogenase family protein [archaeon]|nr:MAG: aldehyde dehydrogenase family protein [archaeon]
MHMPIHLYIGVLNIVPGTGPVTGEAICTHTHVRKIDLTGGTSTGRLVGKNVIMLHVLGITMDLTPRLIRHVLYHSSYTIYYTLLIIHYTPSP